LSKKTKATHPKREKKAEKPARKPAKARRAPPKVAPPAKPVEKVVEKEREPVERYLIAVRVDMPVVKPPEESTLNALRMKTRFSAVLLRDNPSIRGMLQRVKDHVTWAEAKKEDIKLLLSNRARTSEGLGISSKFVKEKTKLAGLSELLSGLYSGKITLGKLWEIGVKPVFRLHPPRGGFAKSSKRPFTDRGELGYRKDGLHDLLTKMC
jgi:large subunit ribosomal protein L30